MAEFGSGLGRQHGRKTTSDMHPLDIRRLQRAGVLKTGQLFSWQWTVCGKEVSSIQARTEVDRVILIYKNRSSNGEWHPMEYAVDLEWTACTLGGRRVWFRCPAQGCGRRVAVLFGGSIFACRHCHKLAYQCQRETDDDRAIRRYNTIRRRLGWKPGFLNGYGGKPKGMHWRTFERLTAEHDAFVNASLVGMAQRLGLVTKRLDDVKRMAGQWS
jgi:hypothetical protein